MFLRERYDGVVTRGGDDVAVVDVAVVTPTDDGPIKGGTCRCLATVVFSEEELGSSDLRTCSNFLLCSRTCALSLSMLCWVLVRGGVAVGGA